MSYSLLQPEINSALIYAGEGSGAFLAAAAAWTNLSKDLAAAATATHSVIANLDGSWTGIGATAASAATAPYVAWLEQASATAAHNAVLATQAATLYETARSSSVTPAAVAANRAMLLALLATNFFGQNATAIATTEHQYEAMWAQDGLAMDTYAASSQANTKQLKTIESPVKASTSSGQAQAAAATSDSTTLTGNTSSTGVNISTVGNFLNSVDLGWLAKDLPGIIGNTPLSQLENLQSITSVPYMGTTYGMMVMRFMMMIPQLSRIMSMGSMGALASQTAGVSGTGTLMSQIGDFVNDRLKGAVGVLAGHFSSATNAISAKLGQAASMGSLKVPQAWSAAADGMVRAAPVLPSTTVSAPIHTVSATSGMPGLPGGPFGHAMMGAMAGRGIGAIAAKAPKVVPRSPAGG